MLNFKYMNSAPFPPNPVLIVDDEEHTLKSLSNVLKSSGISNIICCQDSRKVLDISSRQKICVLLLDLNMPHISGEKLLPMIRLDYPNLPIIIITGVNEASIAVECIKMGAFDYLVKAIESNKLIASVRRAIEIQELREENRILKKSFLSNTLENPEAFSSIITDNDRMRSLFLYIESIAKTAHTILIRGETGVGKELIANIVHTLSRRRGECVKVNVAGLDDNLLSDTLFGHRKGAYTGALNSRSGLIEKALDGTLFLDEIGDLSNASQLKLLRILETQEYYALGSDVAKKSNAQIVVITNKSLNDLIAAGKFRKDLYYRLSRHEVEIPPLRDRMDDLPLLIDYFIEKSSQELGKKKPTPPTELYTLLGTYHFPGNIRELKSMIFDAVSTHKKGILSLESFKRITERKNSSISMGQNESPIIFTHMLPTLREGTRLMVKEAMKKAKGNQSIAARLLGISQSALSKRLLRERDKDISF